MPVLIAALWLAAAPLKAPAGLANAWYDHGTLFLVLRSDGTGQLGSNLIKWNVSETQKSTLDIVTADDTQHLPFVVRGKGKTLELQLPSTKIELEKGKMPPSEADKAKAEKAAKEKAAKAEAKLKGKKPAQRP